MEGPAPDRALFRGKRYAPVSLSQYGRGCRFSCDFCSIHAFYGTSLRQRPIRDLVAEIEAMDRRHIFLVDDNIFVDPEKAEELLLALIPLGIRWSCQVSIDIAFNDRLMSLMERSGCTTAVIGFESLNKENLRQMRKAWNLRHGGYADAVKRFRDRGIMIYGTFVFGYDHDTPEAFDASLEFALRSRFYLANFNPLTPTPGAALHARLRREGRLRYEAWWLEPRYRYGMATFHPKGMTAEQLEEGCFRARSVFNRYTSIATRLADTRANARSLYRVGLYLASNLISRREVHRKQGLRLGVVPA
jgi:radical SAM superfamily enzyme YgiQ (UPF0313 family)